MSEKIQAKKQELLDEIVTEIKAIINKKMDEDFVNFVHAISSLRNDQVESVFGEDFVGLNKEYWKLK